MTPDRGTPGRTDEGFSLVEVIAALVLLGIVATAAAYFFISGTRTSTHLQRTQNAVAVANEAMEMAFAVEPRDSVAVPGVSTLVVGRSRADVEAAWAAASAAGVEGVADTYPAWDPTVSDSAGAVLPLTMPIREYSGQQYHVTILVGTCFRAASLTGAAEDCVRLASYPSDPGDAGTPSGMVRMLRVMAVVTWEARVGECDGGTCTYQLSGLIDRSSDIEWNHVIEPVAVDDFTAFVQGQSGPINVLDNDMLGPVVSNPVTILSAPTVGTASVAANGMVTYAAPAWGSGKYTLTYRLKDASGQQSAPATVTVAVPPLSANDTVSVYSGVPATISPTTNDNGTPGSVEIMSGPAHGSAVLSGINIVYTASIETGQDTVQYRYTDTSGQTSDPAIVTINIASFPVGDRAKDVLARPAGAEVWTSLEETILTGITPASDYRINIVGPRPAAGILSVNGSPTATSGTDVNYSPPANMIGQYSFQFSLTKVDSGWTSATRTVTIRVLPVATADPAGNLRRNGTRDIAIGTNDMPSVFGGTTNVTVELGAITANCGTWPTGTNPQPKLTSGIVQITLPRSTIDGCSFTYALVGSGTLSGLRSSTVTVTYRVVN